MRIRLQLFLFFLLCIIMGSGCRTIISSKKISETEKLEISNEQVLKESFEIVINEDDRFNVISNRLIEYTQKYKDIIGEERGYHNTTLAEVVGKIIFYPIYAAFSPLNLLVAIMENDTQSWRSFFYTLSPFHLDLGDLDYTEKYYNKPKLRFEREHRKESVDVDTGNLTVRRLDNNGLFEIPIGVPKKVLANLLFPDAFAFPENTAKCNISYDNGNKPIIEVFISSTELCDISDVNTWNMIESYSAKELILNNESIIASYSNFKQKKLISDATYTDFISGINSSFIYSENKSEKFHIGSVITANDVYKLVFSEFPLPKQKDKITYYSNGKKVTEEISSTDLISREKELQWDSLCHKIWYPGIDDVLNKEKIINELKSFNKERLISDQSYNEIQDIIDNKWSQKDIIDMKNSYFELARYNEQLYNQLLKKIARFVNSITPFQNNLSDLQVETKFSLQLLKSKLDELIKVNIDKQHNINDIKNVINLFYDEVYNSIIYN